jgi:molecular chaperone DnaK (HSP70)
MARGWESKSVESQIESAGSAVDRDDAATREQLKRRQKRESLELSRRRVLQEIETTHSEVRRASLQQALAYLEEQIEGLQ